MQGNEDANQGLLQVLKGRGTSVYYFGECVNNYAVMLIAFVLLVSRVITSETYIFSYICNILSLIVSETSDIRPQQTIVSDGSDVSQLLS
jgi:hypothetical protein